MVLGGIILSSTSLAKVSKERNTLIDRQRFEIQSLNYRTCWLEVKCSARAGFDLQSIVYINLAKTKHRNDFCHCYLGNRCSSSISRFESDVEMDSSNYRQASYINDVASECPREGILYTLLNKNSRSRRMNGRSFSRSASIVSSTPPS